ncbi:MAG: hypothetical protein KBG15_17645 [Kofleriaceae bacterium]|nr:hypothetical protein [Kofleriaceae bacterium]
MRVLSLLVALCMTACNKSDSPPAPPRPTARAGATSDTTQTPVTHDARTARPLAAAQHVASIADVLRVVIDDETEVIGFGELHERVGTPSPQSALSQFTEHVLPILAAETAYLVVETWSPPLACGQAAQQVTRSIESAVQRPVATKSQVAQLAEAARTAGITPVAMNFSCADYAALRTAASQNPDDQIIMMLDLTTRELAAQTNAAWTKRTATGRHRILVYGGGLHNNRHPVAGVTQWSFAAALSPAAQAHYVEIDWYPRGLAYHDPAVLQTGRLPPVTDHPNDVWIVPQGERSFMVLLPDSKAVH